MNYAISDIHGHYSSFMRLLGKLNLTPEDKVYILGDVIDRAPSTHEQVSMIQWCLTNITEDGQFQMVIGNHEYDVLESMSDTDNYNYDVNDFRMYHIRPTKYKGITNIESVDNNYRFYERMRNARYNLTSFVDFIKTLPLFKILFVNNEIYVLTHSWIIGEKALDTIEDIVKDIANGNNPEINIHKSLWDRYRSLTYTSTDLTVIHGHTPTLDRKYTTGNGGINKWCGNINIDAGMYWGIECGGNLAAYCIETGKPIFAYDEDDRNECRNHMINKGLFSDDFVVCRKDKYHIC